MSIEFELKCHRCSKRILRRVYAKIEQLLDLREEIYQEVNERQPHEGAYPLCVGCQVGPKIDNVVSIWENIAKNDLQSLATAIEETLTEKEKP